MLGAVGPVAITFPIETTFPKSIISRQYHLFDLDLDLDLDLEHYFEAISPHCGSSEEDPGCREVGALTLTLTLTLTLIRTLTLTPILNLSQTG